MLEVAQAVADEVGATRTGIRISPISPMNDLKSSDSQAQFEHIVAGLDKIGIVYIHVFEMDLTVAPFDYARLLEMFSGTYMANNAYDRDRAEASLATGRADLFALGRPIHCQP